MKTPLPGHKRTRLSCLRHFERPWPWIVVCECGWTLPYDEGPAPTRWDAVVAHRRHKARISRGGPA